ncbi:MAG: ABC transporter ATP-binding protein [Rhizobiaceae bacterium]
MTIAERRTDELAGSSIRFQDVSKRYGDFTAVEPFSLDIHAGEFLSLLGPSGSGKTTVLMMLAGFETTSGGRIEIAGRDLTFVPANRRGIGMVFQRYALFPHMSVAQNIAFPLRMRKVPKPQIRSRVQTVLGMVQLEGHADRLPNQLSGGQQQRVAVARALVYDPSVLLMDEPLGALDKKLREQMQLEIKALQQSIGVTVVYVTHDQDEALTMSDRVAVLHRGKFLQVASPKDLYLKPNDALVADFIGKMNFADASVAAHRDGRLVLKTADGGTIVSASAQAAQGVSGPLRAGIRPEKLRLLAAGETSPFMFDGRVEKTIFVGSVQVVLVRALGTLLHLHMLAQSDSPVAEGADVVVAYDPSHVLVFPS